MFCNVHEYTVVKYCTVVLCCLRNYCISDVFFCKVHVLFIEDIFLTNQSCVGKNFKEMKLVGRSVNL